MERQVERVNVIYRPVTEVIPNFKPIMGLPEVVSDTTTGRPEVRGNERPNYSVALKEDIKGDITDLYCFRLNFKVEKFLYPHIVKVGGTWTVVSPSPCKLFFFTLSCQAFSKTLVTIQSPLFFCLT